MYFLIKFYTKSDCDFKRLCHTHDACDITTNEIMSQQQLSGVIGFASYSEKVINDSSKWLVVFYIINNNIIKILTLKRNIFNDEKGSKLKMLPSFHHMAMQLPC